MYANHTVLQNVNRRVQYCSESRAEFTDHVSRVVSNADRSRLSGGRDSLDFQYQKEMRLAGDDKAAPHQGNYPDSKKIQSLKVAYMAANQIPSEQMVQQKYSNGDQVAPSPRKRQATEFLELKETATAKLQELREVHEIKEVLRMNPDLNDEVTESSFEALVCFNDDMKQLALSAYQLHDLMRLVQEENNIILQIMGHQECLTLECEDKLRTIMSDLEAPAGRKKPT